MARLPAASQLKSQLNIPESEQMATVWPTDEDRIATDLDAVPLDRACNLAVDHYGLVLALGAINDAGLSNVGRGPFLLAWSPGADKGKPGALVLKMDLSTVTTAEEAGRVFLQWRNEIERDPTKWSSGWSGESLRDMLRRFVDARGDEILELLGYSQ